MTGDSNCAVLQVRGYMEGSYSLCALRPYQSRAGVFARGNLLPDLGRFGRRPHAGCPAQYNLPTDAMHRTRFQLQGA